MPYLLNAYGQSEHTGNNNPEGKFIPGENSSRLSFELPSPRRYATRFNAQTRTLEIRVIPANAREFSETRFYDTHHIHRIYIEEKNGEVILGIQLKNEPIGWIVDTQNAPWRILVDLWKLEPNKIHPLEEDWRWQERSSSAKNNLENKATTDPVLKETAIVEIKYEAKTEEEKNKNPLKYTKRGKYKKSEPKVRLSENTPQIENYKKYKLPEIFSRIESFYSMTGERLIDLKQKIGSLFGTPEEFDSAKTMAKELYLAGYEEHA
ncbi:MAG: hypothetical protein K2X39_05075, partial [Silvanigrellaceae bacterium]|nr:hypothetical protein [Silvanigrellaceae bacterium]